MVESEHVGGDSRVTTKFCYLIMCHTDREIVERLVRRVFELHPEAVVVLRHDRGPDFITAEEAARWGAELFPSDLRIAWGGWSMITATLEAFRHVRDHHNPDWLVLISGHDYPARPLREWAEEVAASNVDAFVAPSDEPQAWRYTHRWWPLPRWTSSWSLPPKVTTAWWKWWYRWQRSVLFAELSPGNGWLIGLRRVFSPFPYVSEYTQASQWMTLSRRALQQLLAQDSGDPARRKAFSLTRITDEAYLQTLLCNDPALRVQRRRTTWVNFVGQEAHPRPLTEHQVREVVRSGTPFARKVVAGISDVAVERLDAVTSDFAADASDDR